MNPKPNEEITVEILPDLKSAKEVNPLGENRCNPQYRGWCENHCQGQCWSDVDFEEWNFKENNLRTFQLNEIRFHNYENTLKRGGRYLAEIVDEENRIIKLI